MSYGSQCLIKLSYEFMFDISFNVIYFKIFFCFLLNFYDLVFNRLNISQCIMYCCSLFFNSVLVCCFCEVLTSFEYQWPVYMLQCFINFCCYYCSRIKNAYPCCFMHLFCSNFWMFTNCCCQCKRDSKKSSILAETASIPTSFVAFLYMLKVAKYFCMVQLSGLVTLVFESIIGFFWDKVFHNK